MKIQFLGADRQVTGSSHLLEAGGLKILVDCGLYQERPYLDRNWQPFPAAPDDIDVVCLTHAHLDHSGFLPRLLKQGFSRKILATAATIELTRIVLLDAANIQEEDTLLKKKRHDREGRRGPHPEIPLYTVEEALRVVPLFEAVAYLQTVRLNDLVTVRFHDAGHILGSAMLEIVARDEDGGPARQIIFSGDIGRWNKPLVEDPSVFEAADDVVMESTYGDKDHEDVAGIEGALAGVINDTIARGGNIVVPIFAIERAQEFLYYLARLIRSGEIPRLLVLLDSPMAVEVTEVFSHYPSLLDREAQQLYRSGQQPFEFQGLKLITSPEESKAINRIRGSAIILAGSGMCTGGRIKHHLMHNIERPECTVVFVGYQARHTLGRQILEGQPEVRINGQKFRVLAQVAQIEGFSGHADKADLLRWLRAFKKPPQCVFLTHGEEEISLNLATFLESQGWPVTVPHYQETYELDACGP
jgi:metallo-beta-lactamase family protein